MNKMMIAAILSIVLAVAVPLLLAAKAHNDLRASPVTKIKITTYDPRDLLYGHYMVFRYDWNWIDTADDRKIACYGDDCCLCAGPGKVDPPVTLTSCAALSTNTRQCTQVIKGRYIGSEFTPVPPSSRVPDSLRSTAGRYYIDETLAPAPETLFRAGKETFYIGLSLSTDGRAMIEKMYIGDQTAEDYLKSHPESMPGSVRP